MRAGADPRDLPPRAADRPALQAGPPAAQDAEDRGLTRIALALAQCAITAAIRWDLRLRMARATVAGSRSFRGISALRGGRTRLGGLARASWPPEPVHERVVGAIAEESRPQEGEAHEQNHHETDRHRRRHRAPPWPVQQESRCRLAGAGQGEARREGSRSRHAPGAIARPLEPSTGGCPSRPELPMGPPRPHPPGMTAPVEACASGPQRGRWPFIQRRGDHGAAGREQSHRRRGHEAERLRARVQLAEPAIIWYRELPEATPETFEVMFDRMRGADRGLPRLGLGGRPVGSRGDRTRRSARRCGARWPRWRPG